MKNRNLRFVDMRKFILLLLVCCISNLGFTQDLTKIDLSDLSNNQFIQTNNLEDFSRLATSAEVGVAYIDQGQVRSYNKENGIQLIRVKHNSLQFLNSNLNFANTVEMIVINLPSPAFDIQTIDCSNLEQFQNLKYIYFVFQINGNEINNPSSLNCLSDNIMQYYSNKRPI